MTDWLEKLLEQAGEAVAETENEVEVLFRTHLWEAQARQPFNEKQMDGEILASEQTTGQADPEGQSGRTASELTDVFRGRTVWREEGRQLSETDRLNRGAAEHDLLYQRLVRAGRERGSSRPAAQTVVEQQSAGTPSLTVDQLDRAVRQDSRRYDGGMELY